MKPFRLLKENIQGEYWITDYGEVYYADGDIGDQNHESIALDSIYNELADDFGIDYDNSDPDQLIAEILQKIMDDAESPQERQQFQAMADNNPQELIANQLMAMGDRNAKFKIACAFGRGDAREYAVKVWNWRRVHGHDIECRQLTPQDMKEIARGLHEILDQESSFDDTSSDEDDMEFHISTWAGPRYSVTLGQLESGSLQNKTTIGPQAQALSQAANQQVRDMSIQSMNPAYHPKEINPFGRSVNPFGDSVQPYGVTFTEWIALNAKKH